ncbi:unnamed protein product [Pleuronectes platessa]|uniref:Uncharacterized protein n=1 Tax=Pleuronectes platessa TaxID=8262 RepID=A0A9N7Y4N1_PLEPL|nr:unnamed protein product [Pleuronectes platessa]
MWDELRHSLRLLCAADNTDDSVAQGEKEKAQPCCYGEMSALLSYVDRTEKLSTSQTQRQAAGLDERQIGGENKWTTRKTVRTCSLADMQINRQADDQTAKWKHAGGLCLCRQTTM